MCDIFVPTQTPHNKEASSLQTASVHEVPNIFNGNNRVSMVHVSITNKTTQDKTALFTDKQGGV